MKKYTISMLLIILFGCSEPIEAKLGEAFYLPYGESTQIQDEDILIKFQGVGADSRCPIGLRCVWEGNAEIFLEINEETYTLNTTLEPKAVYTSNYKIELVTVIPYPVHGELIEVEDYLIQLLVTQ